LTNYHNFSGNPLPSKIAHSNVVPLGDTFLLVGGQKKWDIDEFHSMSREGIAFTWDLPTIYKYNVSEDNWTLLPSELSPPEGFFVAMAIERHLFEAGETKVTGHVYLKLLL
jgi:hypothetical protein